MLESSHVMVTGTTHLKGASMKSPLASVGVATVLAAALVLAPGLSPAQADAVDSSITTTSVSSVATGSVATTYGLWFLPCSIGGLRWC